jgi:anti-sigma factor (TIGR02949 family)
MMLLALLMRPRCRWVVRRLQAYLDGELDSATAAKVAKHLETCRRCGLEAAAYDAIKAALARGRAADDEAVQRLREFGTSLRRYQR